MGSTLRTELSPEAGETPRGGGPLLRSWDQMDGSGLNNGHHGRPQFDPQLLLRPSGDHGDKGEATVNLYVDHDAMRDDLNDFSIQMVSCAGQSGAALL